ncbi:MAG TPA: hypothetical protein VGM91_15285 [Conexibacter sp.]
MKQLARIAIDDSKYDPRLWQLLEETGLERDDFEGLDYYSLLPFFVLAGASARSNVHLHGDHSHFESVTLEIPDDLEDAFFSVLPDLLAQLTEED